MSIRYLENKLSAAALEVDKIVVERAELTAAIEQVDGLKAEVERLCAELAAANSIARSASDVARHADKRADAAEAREREAIGQVDGLRAEVKSYQARIKALEGFQDQYVSRTARLEAALRALLDSDKNIGQATGDELREAIADPNAPALVRAQAAAVLQAREALADGGEKEKGGAA